MTTQESFKKRVRERMAKTGERYGAARRMLLAASAQQAPGDGSAAEPERPGERDGWVAQPELSDERVRAATGRGWADWRSLIDEQGLREAGHTAIATWLREAHDVDAWWAQSVTVGYERITGLRLPGQMADGTFTVNVSRTVAVAADELRGLLVGSREDLFPDVATELRSRPGSLAPRIGFPEGVALISLEARADGRTRVSVAHEKLPTAEAADLWRPFWREWLEALAEA